MSKDEKSHEKLKKDNEKQKKVYGLLLIFCVFLSFINEIFKENIIEKKEKVHQKEQKLEVNNYSSRIESHISFKKILKEIFYPFILYLKKSNVRIIFSLEYKNFFLD